MWETMDYLPKIISKSLFIPQWYVITYLFPKILKEIQGKPVDAGRSHIPPERDLQTSEKKQNKLQQQTKRENLPP